MKRQQGYAQVGFGQAFIHSGARVLRWFELYRQRRQLAQLSDTALKDLGLSRADILTESEQPFWKDPLNKG
ncbi:DUF1127 domain-containing protein [Pseudomonas sp. NPDC007930]|uniref:DUF1127 domain-containing protein n=1 Tax=Pseudomonas sp. NPDC007930 TaxID=3364417 RepID=UPI0036E7C9B0